MKRVILLITAIQFALLPVFAGKNQPQKSVMLLAKSAKLSGFEDFARRYNRVDNFNEFKEVFSSIHHKAARVHALKAFKNISKKDYKNRPKVEFKSNVLWIHQKGQGSIKIESSDSFSHRKFIINGKEFKFDPNAGVEGSFTRAFGGDYSAQLINLLLIPKAHGGWITLVRIIFYSALAYGGLSIAACIPAFTNHVVSGIETMKSAGGRSSTPPSSGPKFSRPQSSSPAARKLQKFIKDHFGNCAFAQVEGSNAFVDVQSATYHYCKNIAKSVKDEVARRNGGNIPNIYNGDGVTVSGKFKTFLKNSGVIFDSLTHPKDHFKGIDVWVQDGDVDPDAGPEVPIRYSNTLYWDAPSGKTAPPGTDPYDFVNSVEINDDIKSQLVDTLWKNLNARNECLVNGLEDLAREEKGLVYGTPPEPGTTKAPSQEN